MEKTGATPKAASGQACEPRRVPAGHQCAPGAFGGRRRRLSLPDTWICRRLRRRRCLPGDHRLPHDGEGVERAEARPFFAVDFLDDADAQDLSCACGAHHCVRRRRLVRDLAGRISAAFAPGAVGADLPVELRLQERQRLFRHGGPDQAAAAHLVAVAGVAVLFLHAADRWPGLAACFARQSGINAVVVALQVFAALSLAWCLWASQQDATGSSFFSLQARAWEPLAGGLIAAAEIRRRSEGIADPSWLQSPLVAVAGWVLVAGCIVYPLPEARWPGVLTILPILGSAMIVAARQGSRRRRPARTVSDPARRRLVLLDLSLALADLGVALSWLSVRGYGVGATQKMLMVLASLALGALSYRYVEQPVRIRRDFWTSRRLLAGSGALVRGVGRLCVAGFPEPRFSGQAAGVSVAG